MDERRLEFGVGVLVLAAMGVAIILTFIFGAYPVLWKKEYVITTTFPSVAGIQVDTPVLKNGIKIGRVKDIQPDDNGAMLVMMIDEKYNLKQNQVPRIGVAKLVTGEAQVEFVNANESQRLKLFDRSGDGILQPSESAVAQQLISKEGYHINVEGTAASDPFSILMEFEDEIKNTLSSIENAGNSVQALATSLQTNVETVFGGNERQIKNIAEETSKTIEEFRLTVSDVRSLINDTNLKESLQASLDEFPLLIRDARDTVQVARGVIEGFDDVGESVTNTVRSVERTVGNIERFSEPLGENGEELVTSVMASLQNLDQALKQVAYFGEQLNKGDGTIKRLIEDDELYWQVRRIASNVETLTARVRPIVEDARVFADKIARDPGTLGVRGALNRRPQGTGYK